MSTLARQPCRRRRRSAFTLIELMVVITLLVIFLGIALPVVSAITGSRSTEAARNIVSAMLGRARSEAISRRQQVGMALFVDPATGRSTTAIVAVGAADLTGPASYQAWAFYDANNTEKTVYPAPAAAGAAAAVTPVQYVAGDIVFRLTRYTNPTWTPNQTVERMLTPFNGVVKETVMAFQCTKDHSPYLGTSPGATANNPQDIGTCAPGTGTAWTDYWVYLPPTAAETLDGTYEALPANVGVEVVNNPHVNASVAGPSAVVQVDKYLRTGIVVFDASGKVVTVPFSVSAASQLGRRMGLTKDIGSTATNPLESQVGFALYDLAGVSSATYYSSGDFSLSVPGLVGPTAWANEQQEEAWIDANADLYFVNRFTGAMQKAQ